MNSSVQGVQTPRSNKFYNEIHEETNISGIVDLDLVTQILEGHQAWLGRVKDLKHCNFALMVGRERERADITWEEEEFTQMYPISKRGGGEGEKMPNFSTTGTLQRVAPLDDTQSIGSKTKAGGQTFGA